MKKCLCFLIYVLCIHLYPAPSAADIFQKYAKVIWIDQENQVGAAYARGRKLAEFPILTGDDETPTPPGTYVIKIKEINYYSRQYKTPMPYSLFFDYRGRAIHEGYVAEPGEKSEWATHGCIHVEQPYMSWLYNWAEKGKTMVVVKGRRVWEDKEYEEREGQEAGEERGETRENVEREENSETQENGETED